LRFIHNEIANDICYLSRTPDLLLNGEEGIIGAKVETAAGLGTLIFTLGFLRE
jgi:hypothetical protein